MAKDGPAIEVVAVTTCTVQDRREWIEEKKRRTEGGRGDYIFTRWQAKPCQAISSCA